MCVSEHQRGCLKGEAESGRKQGNAQRMTARSTCGVREKYGQTQANKQEQPMLCTRAIMLPSPFGATTK